MTPRIPAIEVVTEPSEEPLDALDQWLDQYVEAICSLEGIPVHPSRASVA